MTTTQTSICCPRCKAELVQRDSGLRCSGCSSDYRVEDGIVDVRCGRLDYYFNPVPREDMSQLISDAETAPWPSIVRRFMGHVRDNPDWLDDLVIDSRYAWKLCLELPPEGRFLDLGCGLGNLTKNIAPHVGEAVALDLTWERLRFAKRRFARFNSKDRITLIAGGDGPHLPFPDGHFDCVALSGVLEWIADYGDWDSANTKVSKVGKMLKSIFGKTNPREMQIKFLQEVRRVLKPEGQLFVAIENRLNYEYFGKRPDHHTGLWFGSLLPRFAANIYSIVVNRKPYRTYTYSVAGLRDLFKDAGFARQEFLGLLDGYTHLKEIVPLKTENDDFWSSPKSDALMDRIKHSSHFIPAYGVISTNSTKASNTLLRRVVAAVQEAMPAGATISIADFHVTGKEKAVLKGHAGTRPIVIAIPCNSASEASVARHYRLIGHARGLTALASLVPEPLASGRKQNVPYFVESRVSGQPLRDELRRLGRTALVGQVSSLLRSLNPEIDQCAPVALDGEAFERLVRRPLHEMLDFAEDGALAAEAKDVLTRRLLGVPVRFGLFHGDFSVGNIFAHDGIITGLIDWEDGDVVGLPIIDALNYMDSVHRTFTDGATLQQTIPLLATGKWPIPEEQRFFAECFDWLGADPARAFEYAVIYWIYHVRPQLEFSLACDRNAIKSRIDAVARELLRLA